MNSSISLFPRHFSAHRYLTKKKFVCHSEEISLKVVSKSGYAGILLSIYSVHFIFINQITQ